jgi:hypothetical protein
LSANAGTVLAQNVNILVSVVVLTFAADELAAAAKKGVSKVVPVYALSAAVHVLAMLTPELLLSVAPAIICKGVNIPMVIFML